MNKFDIVVGHTNNRRIKESPLTKRLGLKMKTGRGKLLVSHLKTQFQSPFLRPLNYSPVHSSRRLSFNHFLNKMSDASIAEVIYLLFPCFVFLPGLISLTGCSWRNGDWEQVSKLVCLFKFIYVIWANNSLPWRWPWGLKFCSDPG